MNICLIPARTGSKRIPDKNIKYFYGKRIIDYSIDAAVKSKLFDKIYVLTNYEIDDRSGVIIHKRPNKYSGDKVGLYGLFEWFMKKYKIKDGECCILYPCAPFTTARHLQIGYERLIKSLTGVVFPVIKTGQHRNKTLTLLDNKRLFANMHEHNTDDGSFEEICLHAGQWFWVDIAKCLERKSIVQLLNDYIELKDYECQDINTPEDWRVAEEKYRLLELGGYFK